MSETDPADARIEVLGEFTVGGETFSQQARLAVTPEDAYLGFPLSFDPTLVLQAYNDIQDATRDAEAEVNRLTAEIDRQRAIVQAERDAQQASIDAAQRDVDAAQAYVNRINSQISRHYSNIRYYKGRIGSWYRWYKKQPWYKKASAYATYLAKKAYYNRLLLTTNQRTMFWVLNSLLNTRRESLPEHDELHEFCNIFATFFSQKI